ncbi:MAG: hypothetical protein Q9221_003882 [Calogaya cf. arnoldii]
MAESETSPKFAPFFGMVRMQYKEPPTGLAKSDAQPMLSARMFSAHREPDYE